MKLKGLFVLSVIFSLLLGTFSPVYSTSFGSGFDLYSTERVEIDLGFGPIIFVGNPASCATCPGNSDTIVKREPIVPPFDGPPTSDTQTIDIEIVQLHLRSVSPIEVTPGNFFDVRVTLDTPVQPTGSMTVTHSDPDGGVYSSELPIRPKFSFNHVTDPSQNFETFDPLLFVTPLTPWSHNPTPNDAHSFDFPSGGFYPDVVNPDILNPDILNPDIRNRIGSAVQTIADGETDSRNISKTCKETTGSDGVKKFEVTITGEFADEHGIKSIEAIFKFPQPGPADETRLLFDNLGQLNTMETIDDTQTLSERPESVEIKITDGNGNETIVDPPLVCVPESQIIGGQLFPIKTTSLLLGTQFFSWMFPVVLLGIVIGLVFLKRK